MSSFSFEVHECTFQNGSFGVLPNDIVQICKEGYVLYYTDGTLLLYDEEMMCRISKKLSESNDSEVANLRRVILGCSEMIEDVKELGAVMLELLKRNRDKYANEPILNINMMPFSMGFNDDKTDDRCIRIKIVDSMES